VDPLARLCLIEHATAELLESETNGSLTLGVLECGCEPVVVTALGCSVLVAIGPRAAVLMSLRSLRRQGTSGARVLAAGCERTLRTVHGLPLGFAPTVAFDNPVNAARWLGRLRSPGPEGSFEP
jgi:hypothetical protein